MQQEIRVMAVIPGWAKQPGGCEIYRVTQPLYYLGKQPGWITGWMWFADMFEIFKKGADEWLEFVDRFDIFMFPRMFTIPQEKEITDGLAAMMTILRGMGKRIIYETDDDYTNEHRLVTTGDAIEFASWADAITVTTPYLAKTMTQRTKLKSYILPNCVDMSLWADTPAPIRQENFQGKTVIGLTGSATHYKDWQVLAPIMKDFMESNPDVRLILMGFHPDYFDDVPNVVKIPGLTYPQYCSIIKGCDIILCPVDKLDGFNLGKSPIKAVEGMSASRELPDGKLGGAAVIATNNPIYSLAVRHMKTGLLVDQTPEAWKEALQLLIDRRDLREQMQVNALAAARKRYDASKEWKQWAAAYRMILSRPSNSVKTLSA